MFHTLSTYLPAYIKKHWNNLLLLCLSVFLFFIFIAAGTGWEILESAPKEQRGCQALSGRAASEREPDLGACRLSGAGERYTPAGSGQHAQRARPLPEHPQQIREPLCRAVMKRKVMKIYIYIYTHGSLNVLSDHGHELKHNGTKEKEKCMDKTSNAGKWTKSLFKLSRYEVKYRSKCFSVMERNVYFYK